MDSNRQPEMDSPDGGRDPGSRAIELISTVAHEIRSPLTSIKGFTKTLIDRWTRISDEDKIEMLRAVDADADRLTRMLGELLDVSRLEVGRLPIKRTLFDLRELVLDVVTAIGDRSDRHQVYAGECEQIEVSADRDKVRQVITNLVENAIKYTPGGTVRLSCGVEGGFAVIKVRDEGPGIAPDDVEDFFTMFGRKEKGDHPTGTGLGLYICKGIIEAHGGEIGVRTEPGSGSEFWFSLPLHATP